MTVFKNPGNYFISCLLILLCFESCKEDQIQDITKDNTAEVVSTYAGSTEGDEDGPRDKAKFLIAKYLSADKDGNLYIGDYNRIRKISKEGIVSTLAGGKFLDPRETPSDGTGTNASFGPINSIAVSPSGMIYVSDNWPNIYLRRVSPDGVVVTENFYIGDYSGALAIGPDSALYSIDMNPDMHSHGDWVIKQTATGVGIWKNEIPGSMRAISVAHNGDVYLVVGRASIFRLSETRITKLSINPLTTVGKVSSISKSNQSKQLPDGYITRNDDIIDVADDGTVFFADTLRITRIAADGTASVLAGGTKGYVDGPASEARFEHIYAIELAENDKVLFVSDANKIRKITLR